MQPRFEIRYQASDRYVRRALWQFYSYGLSRNLFLWIMLGLLGFWLYRWSRADALGGMFWGLLGLAGLVWYAFRISKNCRQLMRHFAAQTDRTTTIRFYDDRVEDQSAHATLRLPWGFFLRYLKTRDMWFLFFSYRMFLMFPDEPLPDGAGDLLKDKLAAKNKRDFLTCEKCKISLVGCTEARCPHCARPLPLEAMNITAAQFVELSQALAVDLAGELPRPKIRIVQDGFFWSHQTVALAGAITGVVSLVLFWVVYLVCSPSVWVFMLVLLGVPSVVLWRYGQRFSGTGASLLFGLCNALGIIGLLTLLMLVPIVVGQQPLYLSSALGPPTMLKLVALMLVWSPLWSWSAWGLILRVRGRAMLPHRFECAKCAYSLLGNSSGVCPECGTEIPFEQLGVSAQELQALSRPTDLHDTSRNSASDPP